MPLLRTSQVKQRLIKRAQQLGSQKALAAELGISQQYLSDIFLGKREISYQLAEKLGLKKIIYFRWSPHLEGYES